MQISAVRKTCSLLLWYTSDETVLSVIPKILNNNVLVTYHNRLERNSRRVVTTSSSPSYRSISKKTKRISYLKTCNRNRKTNQTKDQRITKIDLYLPMF